MEITALNEAKHYKCSLTISCTECMLPAIMIGSTYAVSLYTKSPAGI